MKRLAPSLAFMFALCGVATANAQNPEDEGDVEYMFYTVRSGDTCRALAKRFFGASKKEGQLVKHNAGLECGEALEVDSVLRIPKPKPDAELTAALRKVQAKGRRDTDWFKAAEGTDLWGGWRVNTLERSAAEVTFRDKSLVQMRQNTLVIIYGGTRTASRAKPSRAELESGALRSRLGEFSSGLDLDTPSAKAELKEGNVLVTVDEEATARLANHGGTDAKLKSKSGGKVVVKDGMGSKVKKGSKPTKPKPLPPTPAWSQGPRTFLGTSLGGGTISGEWAPVEKATAYRVEVARDARGIGVLAAATVPADITKFEIRDLPTGDYYVSIASVDDDKFESKPSTFEPMSIMLLSLTGPGGTEVLYPENTETATEAATAPPPMMLPGGTVGLSSGVTCKMAGTDGERSTELTVTGVGLVMLDCIDADGKAVAPFGVELAKLTVDAATEGSQTVELIAGQTNTVSVSIGSPIPLPDELEIEAAKGIKVVGLTRVDETHWDLVLEPKKRIEGESDVVVGLGGQPLSTVRVTTRPPGKVVAPQPEGPEFHILELGLAGGVFLAPDDHEFFEPGQEQQPFAGPLGDIGLRVGYHPVRFVGAEAEFRLMPGRFEDGSGTTLYGFGGHLIGQLHTRFTPFVLVGGGAAGIFGGVDSVGSDLDGTFYFGGGLKFYAHRRVVVRVDVRDYLAPRVGDDGITNIPQITAGVSVVFGRKTVNRRLARGGKGAAP